LAQANCATSIVQAIEKPVQSDIMKNIIGKLADIDATASFDKVQIQ
jgi:hypothetical protein